jgi:pilus assembly protein Flp/PilA
MSVLPLVDFPSKRCRFAIVFDLKGSAMKSLVTKVVRFLQSEDGPTAVEYAVMLALIVVVCLTAIQAIGTNANVTFNSIASQLGNTGGS